MLTQAIQDRINEWLAGNYDDATKTEIQALQDQGKEEALIDAFYKNLEFGTGGLRGIMGVGPNRMNQYTVGAATQGLANYLKQSFPNQPIKVAIAFDSRNRSQEFAQITANVFSANDIQVYLFPELRPTPLLSFAIRHLGCQSGVVLTASHNPKEYNGYKAYWEDGSQLVAPHDKNVIKEVEKISVEEVKFEAKTENIQVLDKTVEEIYLSELKKLSLSPKAIQAHSDLKIVFTPIHGTAITLVPQALEKFGFQNVKIVEEQAQPNGNFPTVIYPNPEEAEALNLALQQAQEWDADLVLATDPDADRVGIALKNEQNEWQLINGNQVASLLIYYLLHAWKKNQKLVGKEYIVKTIVTTELIAEIANHFQTPCYDTLTGFKNIAKIIREKEGTETFIGGGEESYGYLIGDFVRDKDAVASCAFIAEMFAWAKSEGKTLFDLLLEVYEQFGVYQETLVSIKKEGKTGAEAIAKMMENFRNNPPQMLAGSKVSQVLDYQELEKRNLILNQTEKLNFDQSNVLQFFTEDGTKISARPSGTEPKIKFYVSVKAALDDKGKYREILQILEEKIKQVIKDLGV